MIQTQDRGQAIGIARGLAALVAFAMIWGIMSRPFNMIQDRSANVTDGADASTGVSWLDSLWGYQVWFVLVVVAFGLIALGVYQRGAP